MDKKYRFNMLGIEITRRCNKRCAHCLRGDAQDMSMNTEIIDRIFEDTQDVLCIILGSGEALLEPNLISYFVDKLVESQWSTRKIEITTNGTICEPQIIDAFEKFCVWKHGRIACLRISNDPYHDRKEYEKAYAFYRPLVDAANERITKIRPYSMIDLHYVMDEKKQELEDGYTLGLTLSGRATKLEGFIPGKNAVLPYRYSRRIKIIGTEIPCALQISANGNVTFYESDEYEQLDAISIGNILDSSFTELIDSHNAECPVLCSEMALMHRIENSKYATDIEHSQRHFNYILEQIYSRIIELRYHARKQFPHIPAQQIIDNIPFPDIKKLYDMIFAMYKHCPDYTENMITNIKKYTGTHKEQIYMGAMYTAITMHLKDKKISRKYPYWLFGTEKDCLEFLCKKFEELDEYYEINPDEADNNKIFFCEPDENNIVSYSEEFAVDGWLTYDELLAGRF